MNSKDSSSVSIGYWSEKPFWCKPWSILLSGIIFLYILFSYVQLLWIKITATLLILSWWILFLFLVPVAYESNLRATKDQN